MHFKLLSFIFSLITFQISAQVLSNGGRFSVDFDRGCVPFEINVTELDGFGIITRQYFYEPGTTETTSTTYTYNSAGTFEIVQVLGIDVTPKTDTLIVEVIDPTPTEFILSKCSLNGITITSSEDLYDSIRVYFTPNDSVTLLNGESASYNYSIAGTQAFQTQGFYNNAKENCTRFDHTFEASNQLSTPSVLETSIKEICLDFFVLEIEIDDFDPEIEYQVIICKIKKLQFIKVELILQDFVFEDIAYDPSSSQYCLSINAVDDCLGQLVEGAQFCQEISTLSSTPFENIYSSYENDAILINMDSVSVGVIEVYRKLGESGEFELRNSVQSSYLDPIGSLFRRYFYRVDYVDSCGQILSSVETNPPLFESTMLSENSYNLNYVDPINTLGSPTRTYYQIGNEISDEVDFNSNSIDLRLNSKNGTRQFLQAFSEYTDGIITKSNTITYKYESIVYVPKAFTPNNDGLNDTLELFGLPTEVVTTNIYSRWGQLIYTSETPTPGWDGAVNGQLAPEGTYLYEIIYQDSDGEKVVQKGTFALIKK